MVVLLPGPPAANPYPDRPQPCLTLLPEFGVWSGREVLLSIREVLGCNGPELGAQTSGSCSSFPRKDLHNQLQQKTQPFQKLPRVCPRESVCGGENELVGWWASPPGGTRLLRASTTKHPRKMKGVAHVLPSSALFWTWPTKSSPIWSRSKLQGFFLGSLLSLLSLLSLVSPMELNADGPKIPEFKS